MSVGRTTSSTGAAVARASRRGVTLLEMLIVISIIAVITGISYPSIASGLDNLKIGAAADSVAAFLDSAAIKADRRQAVVEVTISRRNNLLFLRSTDPTLARKFDFPEGVRIEQVFPEVYGIPVDAPRQFVIYPGGAVPAMGVSIVSDSGKRRLIRIHPITGIPVVERPNLEAGK
ncbi:MAG: prepilin-type N-terminal cleavage/methylation domain-containing protein [Bryobacteraceae bacterium]